MRRLPLRAGLLEDPKSCAYGIVGGLAAYPLAIAFLGQSAADIAFTAYVVPFLISTVAGSILAGILLFALQKNGSLKAMQSALER